MTQSFLVQRLLPPFEKPLEPGRPSVDMVFGGARDLTQEQHDTICDLFRLDSMGSAHFEFGAVPNALYRLATNKNLQAYQVDMVLNAKGPALNHMKLTPKIQTIHIIATPDSLRDVLQEIKTLANGDEHALKCTAEIGLSIFHEELQLKKSWAASIKKIHGWHDIENDFLFFIDKKMFDGIRTRFEISGDVMTLPQIGKLDTQEEKVKAQKRAPKNAPQP